MTDTTQPSCRTHLTDAEVATLTAERDAARAALAPLDGTDWTPATLLRAYREMSQAHEDGQREVGRLTATRDRVVAAADALEVDGMHEAAQRIRAALNPDAHPRAVPITSAERASLLDGALARATRERDEARAEAQRLAGALTNARAVAAHRLADRDKICREVMAERDQARTEMADYFRRLDRALELIAELCDVGERADRAFARYDTKLDGARCAALNLLAKERANSGSGRDGHLNEDDLAPLLAALRIDAAPDLGSVPRAQGVAVDRPEIAVDGPTPATGTLGMAGDANGAQNAAQAAVLIEADSVRGEEGEAVRATARAVLNAIRDRLGALAERVEG